MKELLFADELVLTGESREEVGWKLLKLNRVMESKRLKINIEKAK